MTLISASASTTTRRESKLKLKCLSPSRLLKRITCISHMICRHSEVPSRPSMPISLVTMAVQLKTNMIWSQRLMPMPAEFQICLTPVTTLTIWLMRTDKLLSSTASNLHLLLRWLALVPTFWHATKDICLTGITSRRLMSPCITLTIITSITTYIKSSTWTQEAPTASILMLLEATYRLIQAFIQSLQLQQFPKQRLFFKHQTAKRSLHQSAISTLMSLSLHAMI